MNSATSLPAYYCAIFQRSDVPSSAPVFCNLAEGLRILNCLRSDQAFFGLVLSERIVLQFARDPESGAIYTEWLDREERCTEWCLLSLPLAEELLRCAYRWHESGQPPNLSVLQESVAVAFIAWHADRLPSIPAV